MNKTYIIYSFGRLYCELCRRNYYIFTLAYYKGNGGDNVFRYINAEDFTIPNSIYVLANCYHYQYLKLYDLSWSVESIIGESRSKYKYIVDLIKRNG